MVHTQTTRRYVYFGWVVPLFKIILHCIANCIFTLHVQTCLTISEAFLASISACCSLSEQTGSILHDGGSRYGERRDENSSTSTLRDVVRFDSSGSSTNDDCMRRCKKEANARTVKMRPLHQCSFFRRYIRLALLKCYISTTVVDLGHPPPPLSS